MRISKCIIWRSSVNSRWCALGNDSSDSSCQPLKAMLWPRTRSGV